MVPDTVILAGGDTAVKPRDRNVVAGNILPHEADRCAGGEIVADPGQETEGFAGEAGKNQVPDQCAPKHDTVRGILRRAGLAAHLRDSRCGFFEIIRGAGAQTACARGIVLEIRQVDIDGAVEEPDGVNRFITGSVPDDGERRTPKGKGPEDLGDKGCRGDEGDRVDAEIRQPLQ